MPKKPTPSKKQAVSSTRSRYGAYVRKKRIKLDNAVALDKCQNCGEKKRRHYACQECGMYRGKQIFEPKQKVAPEPIQEIQA